MCLSNLGIACWCCLPNQCTVYWYVSRSVYCPLMCLPSPCLAQWCVFLLHILHSDVSPCSMSCTVMFLPSPCLAQWCVSLLHVLHSDVSPCSMSCTVMCLPAPGLAQWCVSLLHVLHSDVSPCSMSCTVMCLPAPGLACWRVSLLSAPPVTGHCRDVIWQPLCSNRARTWGGHHAWAARCWWGTGWPTPMPPLEHPAAVLCPLCCSYRCSQWPPHLRQAGLKKAERNTHRVWNEDNPDMV